MCGILVAAAALLSPAGALAAAVVTTLKGDVRAGNVQLAPGARISSGSTVALGADAKATLTFDDGMRIVLDRNTTFRITGFVYASDSPASDHVVLDLQRGAMRMITGTIGKRSPQALALRAPQASIEVRGTDFMVALVNPAFLQVLTGSIAAVNGAGAVVLAAGTFAQIANASSLPVPSSPEAVAEAARGAFARLLEGLDPVVGLLPDGTTAGAGTSAAALPTTGTPGAVLMGIGAAAVWVLSNGGSTVRH